MSIINFFDNCRFWGNRRNPILQIFRFYGIMNRIIDYCANLFLPIYFKLTQNNPNYKLKDRRKVEKRIIVSFTSFPARINSVWLVVETMFRQTYTPDKIILYLSREQFSSMDEIPKSLREQQGRGLEIVLCEDDLKSHKKYYYAMQKFPLDIIITIDDDIFYRTDFIETLVKQHQLYPDMIIANWAKNILSGKKNYNEWPDATPGTQSVYMLPIGVGGVLYPPNCLYEDYANQEVFKKYCFKADDVWLTCMSILNNTIKKVSHYHFSYVPIIIRSNETLLDTNRSQNQVQINNLNKFYKLKIGISPFIS